ncbi:MAG TPA: phosphate ABC transporter substrate-binding protein [Anaerolineales bacterium]|nr:phosphate ABC transporter substrate-binding protein [Anaerolineales bacterium]
MSRKTLLLLTGLLVLALVASGCRPTPTPSPTPAKAELSGKIVEAGSTTVQPLAEKLAEAFMAKHPKVDITVQGGGSSVGIKSVGEGTVDVGAASREVKDSEREKYPDLKVFTIARDGIAIVVHPDVPVNGLTKEQVKGIFAGEITNWREVGGPDRPIVVVSREEGSGTRAAFEEMVMGKKGPPITEKAILQPSNGAVRTTVATTPDSIGYLSFGYLDESVKALAIDGVEATEANAASGEYPIVRPLNFLTKGEPTGLVKAWLDFILGDEGQQIVAEEGYIAVR